jgi:hypothetical protein
MLRRKSVDVIGRTRGTRSCYGAGCRCPACKEANRLHQAKHRLALRLRRVERGELDPEAAEVARAQAEQMAASCCEPS